MAITNLTDLRTRVTDLLRRAGETTFEGRLEDLIMAAEKRIERTIPLPELDKTAVVNVVSDTEWVAWPTDVIRLQRVRITNPVRRTLPSWELGQLREEFQARANDVPMAYAVFGTRVYLGPRPSTGVTLEIEYTGPVPMLTTLAPTNAILTKYPDLYLYSTLLEASTTLAGAEGAAGWLAMWQQAYQSAVDTATSAGFASVANGNAVIRRKLGGLT